MTHKLSLFKINTNMHKSNKIFRNIIETYFHISEICEMKIIKWHIIGFCCDPKIKISKKKYRLKNPLYRNFLSSFLRNKTNGFLIFIVMYNIFKSLVDKYVCSYQL